MSNKIFNLSVSLGIIFSLFVCNSAFSQAYQFENAGFEQWDGNSGDEPTGWNSFPSANCNISIPFACSTATAKKHERSTDVREGANGQYSCCIYSKSVLGIVANGALTSGQMELVSTNMSDNGNGNKTITSNEDFNHRLNAKPDSIVFWAKVVNASNDSKACCHLYIHDNYDLKDPLAGNPAGYEQHIVGKVSSYEFANDGSTWKRHSVAIDYDNCLANDPQFILITFSTNVNAGGGSNGDKLFIDDIELIYNANLTGIAVNGVEIPDFDPEITDYNVNAECGATNTITATTFSPFATYTIEETTETNSTSITVLHGDKEKVYTIHFQQAVAIAISDDICLGNAYTENGFALEVQNEVGTFEFSREVSNPNGCDSVITLTLNVRETYTATIEETIVEGEVYDFFGQACSEAGDYTQTLTSEYGCDSIIVLHLIVEPTTNISSEQILVVKVFPNPASEIINIVAGKEIERLEIISVTGQVLANKEINASTITHNLADLKSGKYLLRLHFGNGKTEVVEIVKGK